MHPALAADGTTRESSNAQQGGTGNGDDTMLEPGKPAPTFSRPDADMETVDLARFRGRKNVVLLFYAKDGSPACTMQATEFSDHQDEFARLHCVVLGVSPDDCFCHAEFRDANGVSITLLADTETEVSSRYGVVTEQIANGIRRASILRSTFIIDKQGMIRHALCGTNPRGHVHEVLELVRAIEAEAPRPRTRHH